MLLAGCANTKNPPEQITEAAQTETEAAETVTAAVIHPLPDTTMEALEDSVVNISFEQDDVYRDGDGNVFLRMKIYSYDKFDMVDISGLKAGDTIRFFDGKIHVDNVERNDYGTVLINGGLDEGGFDLATDDSGVYYVQGYSDMKSWYQVGEAEYPVSGDFVFTDRADLEQGEITCSAEDLLENIHVAEYGYQPQNTTVRIENGQVVAMERCYTP
jgi:hypothetical protein